MQNNVGYKRIPPAHARDIPLAEVDPKVSDDTFCVFTRSWDQMFLHRYNRSPSLNLFHPYSPIRRAAIAFTTHVGYDIGLLIIVIGNLIELAIPNSMPRFFERVSILFYMSETIHQSISRGFVLGTYTYLRNPWMCLDFIITLASLPNMEFFKKKVFALQSLRGIRILNLIIIVPGVRAMAQGVMLSLSQMFGAILLFFIFLLSVTITAKHLFKGVLFHKCVKTFTSNSGSFNVSYEDFIKNDSNWLKEGDDWYICGNLTGAQYCPEGYVCLPDIKNNFEYTHFDTFDSSLFNSLGLITHDDWDLIIDEIGKATGPLSGFFFAPVIFFGSFCLLNLMLVVVITTYEAMVSAKAEKDKILSVHTYHSKFKFDIRQLSLFHLPTNEETLNRILRERDDLLDHKEAVHETWNRVRNVVTLKQKVLRKLDPKDVGQHEIETAPNGKNAGQWEKFRLRVKHFTLSKVFRYTIISTIVINLIFLASEHAQMSKEILYFLETGDKVFLAIYFLEIILLLIANGVQYFFDWWNFVDFIVVVLGISAIFSTELGELIAFRSLRLLRLVRLQQSWSALQRVVSVILNSFKNMLRLIIVMSLLILMFAIIGNRVVGPLYDFQNHPTHLRWSFATFGGSLFTVFKIFTGEWIEDLWSCMRKSDKSPICPIVFISYFLIGNLVIVSLFAALLLSSFDESSLQFAPREESFIKRYFTQAENFLLSVFSAKKRNSKSEIKDDVKNLDVEAPKETEQSTINTESKSILSHVRQFIQKEKFEYIIYAVIVANCISMALQDSTVEKGSERDKYLFWIDTLCVAFFLLEMIVRWFVNGIANYFRNGWTLFDFCINVLSIIEIPFHSTGLTVLRALRPLRIISNWHEMKVIYGAFVLSVPAILHVIIVCMFLWLPFAVIGLNFFAGNFYRCADEFNEIVEDDNILNKTDCIQKNHTWRKAFFNFDHIGNCYLSLLQLALFSGWDDSVHMMVDYRGPDLQPETDFNKWKYIYVITFILVGGFLCFNLFVGAAVNTFRNMEKQVEGFELIELQLTLTQKKHYHAMMKFIKRKPTISIEAPSSHFSNVCYHITCSWWFRITIFFFICANAITVAVDSHHNPPLTEEILKISEYIFTCAYTIEFLIKILGLRKFYFKDFWNIFDLTILILYMTGEILHKMLKHETNLMSFVYAFRILRIFPLLRLTDMFVDLRLLLYSLEASFTSLLNLSLLLFLIVFIYSILGMTLFGNLKHSISINSNANFETWVNSALLLLRLSTAEGWERIIEALSLAPPDCDQNLNPSNCGNRFLAPLFLLTYLFCTYILFMNIFIAVILDNYKAAVSEEKDIFKEDNLISFYRKWKVFDPTATHYIPYEHLSNFLDELNRDLRIPKPNYVTVAFMNLPITIGNKVHCLYVLQGILKVKFGEVEDSAVFRDLKNQMEKKYEKLFPELKASRFINTTMDLKRMDRAARIIQAHLKRIRESKFKKEPSKLFSTISQV